MQQPLNALYVELLFCTPKIFFFLFQMNQLTGYNKQIIRQSINIFFYIFCYLFVLVETDYASFGTAAYGTCHMSQG